MAVSNHGYINSHLKQVHQEIIDNKPMLLKIVDFVVVNSETYDFTTRAEWDKYVFFTNDDALVAQIKSTFQDIMYEEYIPESDDAVKFLSGNTNKILTNKLPFDTYKYKVYFSTKSKIPLDTRINFLKWQTNYSTKIHLPPASLKMDDSNWFEWGKYFYVSDDKMLNLALLYLGSYIQKTEEYVLKSDTI
jgi:hypothetical protein